MPTLTYPGIYTIEIPSGLATIVGAPTSRTAFVGRAAKGQTNFATTVTSFSDYERTFGGLADYSSMSFAVRDYFLNGGSEAVIVRLYRDPSPGNPKSPFKVVTKVTTMSSNTMPTLTEFAVEFEAANEGTWSSNVRITIDNNVSVPSLTNLGVGLNKACNLSVVDATTGQAESYTNLVFSSTHASSIITILANQSSLIRVKSSATAVNAATMPTAGLADKLTVCDTLTTSVNNDSSLAAADRTTRLANIAIARAGFVSERAASDGRELRFQEFLPANAFADKKGLYALEGVDIFNLLCIPPYLTTSSVANQDVDTSLVTVAAEYCESRLAFLILDSPSTWTKPNGSSSAGVVENMNSTTDTIGTRSDYSAIFWPRIKQPNPFKNNIPEAFSVVGAVAGVFARTDAERGVWNAPAGLHAVLKNVPELSYNLTNSEQGLLNPLGVNCLRVKVPTGRVIFGCRTLEGDDRVVSDYKQIQVRRTALFLEQSISRSLEWAVHRPNEEITWSQIRLSVGAFLRDQFRKGAFAGTTPKEAYYVKCDAQTTTQTDINNGVMNVEIGFKPLKAAEFVVLKFKQIIGDVQV
jgi:uncharacterized protein